MRIGLVTRRFDPAGGGTERDLVVTAKILTAAGHDVRVYAPEIRRTSELEVHRLRAPGIGRTLRLRAFASTAASAARRDGADLIFSFARILDADILRSGGSAHSSYIVAARQWQSRSQAMVMRVSPYHRVQQAIERHGFAATTLKCAIAVSNLVRMDLIETFGLAPAKVVTLYNGVDHERFRPVASDDLRESMRRKLGIPFDALVVAFAGNGFARKGLRFLLEAWPRLESSPHLIVAGVDQAVVKYQRLARRLDLERRVHFIGATARIEDLFAAVDAFALPSLFEPFGNVVLEAMASGLPVLCSHACGVAEVLPPALREFVVNDPTDLDELAARLQSFLRAGPDLRSIARATAEQFTWESYATNLLKLIASL